LKTKFVSVWDVCPGTPPAEGMKRSQRLVWLALEGYTNLAADTILDTKNKGRVESIVGDAIRQLGQMALVDRESRVRCCEVLVELALNLAGKERTRAGFSSEEAKAAFMDIVETLRRWESQEIPKLDDAAMVVTKGILAEMNEVFMGQSLVAEMAHEIGKELKDGDLLGSFLMAARRQIQENVYFQIVDRGLSKIGNDSATGQRWLRHLGAVQVSSSPVIAAGAFEEAPELWKRFETVAAAHPEWIREPERFADEITMFATVTSLLPNVLDFRPIALLSDFRDGMVCVQLNPFKAGSTEGCKEDAQKICTILQEILRGYDAWLTPEAVFDGRPNVVFEVPSNGPAAIETTRELNELGIGTNNTVTFTASQEVTMAVAACLGLAQALKTGARIGRVYITNMEGRLEDYLRESEGARMLVEGVTEEQATKIAQKLGTAEAVRKAPTMVEKASILCSKKYLKSLTDGWFVEAIGRRRLDSLAQAEKDLRMAGILITRRVFQIAFTPKSASKRAGYLREKAGVSEEEAHRAMGMVDLLAASKRRAEDTLLVLGTDDVLNLTNTDVPDQQLKVWTRARESGFRITDHWGSVLTAPERSCLFRLLKVQDFRRAYELSPELAAELRRAGIEVEGDGGLKPGDWATFGPVVKTMHEFEEAYMDFKSKLVDYTAQMRA